MRACKKCRSCIISTRHFSRLLGALAAKLSADSVRIGYYTKAWTARARAKTSAYVRYSYTSEGLVFQQEFLESAVSHGYAIYLILTFIGTQPLTIHGHSCYIWHESDRRRWAASPDAHAKITQRASGINRYPI